ncbi:MAG: hypothetical protein H0U32_10600 [Thermoleophilaceae bacterium]|nr:hypothetical protein [Thermoleophilaceae bacterium]
MITIHLTRSGLDGPSRTIILDPVEQPSRPAQPERQPEPVREPAPVTPEREPDQVPA